MRLFQSGTREDRSVIYATAHTAAAVSIDQKDQAAGNANLELTVAIRQTLNDQGFQEPVVGQMIEVCRATRTKAQTQSIASRFRSLKFKGPHSRRVSRQGERRAKDEILSPLSSTGFKMNVLH